MPTAVAEQIRHQEETDAAKKDLARSRFRLVRHPLIREILIVLAFCFFTALLTWPYVTRLRDAVADAGDPYLVAWILWWN